LIKKLLICPGERKGLRSFAESIPLAQLPLLGQSLIEYWLTHLSLDGARKVTLLANDRPEALTAFVGDGARWGIDIEVIPESRELTPAEALLKYEDIVSSPENDITLLDHFPGCQEQLFNSHAALFAGLCAWLPHSRMPDRVGVRELFPGVWAGLHARIAPNAQIKAPAWIGKNVSIGTGALVGPGAIVEDGSFIEAEAEIVDSYIGPDTLVGRCTAIRESLVWGNTLINWKNDSVVEVNDAFILCALRRSSLSPARSWLERISELCAPSKGEPELFLKDWVINKEGSS